MKLLKSDVGLHEEEYFHVKKSTFRFAIKTFLVVSSMALLHFLVGIAAYFSGGTGHDWLIFPIVFAWLFLFFLIVYGVDWEW